MPVSGGSAALLGGGKGNHRGGATTKCGLTERVYRVELYAAVRRAVSVGGISEREASRHFGIARRTAHKMLGYRKVTAT
jgi:hypothetical protein